MPPHKQMDVAGTSEISVTTGSQKSVPFQFFKALILSGDDA